MYYFGSEKSDRVIIWNILTNAFTGQRAEVLRHMCRSTIWIFLIAEGLVLGWFGTRANGSFSMIYLFILLNQVG